MKSFDFIILLKSITTLLRKASGHAGGRSSSLSINSVLDSDYEDDDILELERSFSSRFNTFVNQWCVNKNKMCM